MIGDLKSRQELLKEFKSDQLIVVEFYASWCGNCKAIDPTYIKWSEAYTDVKFFRSNVDFAQDLATEYGVAVMPTFIFFRDGDVLEKIVGPKVDQIQEQLDSTK